MLSNIVMLFIGARAIQTNLLFVLPIMKENKTALESIRHYAVNPVRCEVK
jgi:hypothetical protein